jgi:hypothetical protein
MHINRFGSITQWVDKYKRITPYCISYKLPVRENIPSLIASTISQAITVGIRWATVITVQCLNSVRIVVWRKASVALSIEAVASSRTKIRHLLKSARPRQKSCLWPMLQFDPSSTTIMKRSWSVLWMKSYFEFLKWLEQIFLFHPKWTPETKVLDGVHFPTMWIQSLFLLPDSFTKLTFVKNLHHNNKWSNPFRVCLVACATSE